MPWLSRPVRTSVWARWRDGEVDLGVLEGDRGLGGEQLHQLELVVAEHAALAEPLERQHADRAVAPRRGTQTMLPWTGPVGGWRIRSSSYSSTIRTGSLCSRTQVAMPGLAGVPRLEVVLGVDAAGDDRREQPRQLVDELDRDVVRADEVAEAVGDRPEEHRRVERRQDRLGDLEELALAADLLLEGGRLLAQALRRVRARQVDLGVLERDRGLGGEQLGQLELVVAEDAGPRRCARSSARRSRPSRPAQRDAHEAAVDRAARAAGWTRGSSNSSSIRTGSLCSSTHVASPVSPGAHGRR